MMSTFGGPSRPVTFDADPELECRVMGILSKVRYHIYYKNRHSANSLARTFNLFDKNHDSFLEKKELDTLLQSFGIHLASYELDFLMVFFNANSDGRLSLEAFVAGIHGSLNDRRREMVEKVFSSMDVSNCGEITTAEILDRYNPEQIPEVVNGSVSLEDAKLAFIEQLDGNRGESSPTVSWSEFLQHYTEISAGERSDELFVRQLEIQWGVFEVDQDQTRLKEFQALLRRRLEQKASGPSGSHAKKSALKRSFRHFDKDECGSVTPEEIILVLREYNFIVEDNLLGIFMRIFDPEQTGRIDYNQFITSLYSEEDIY